ASVFPQLVRLLSTPSLPSLLSRTAISWDKREGPVEVHKRRTSRTNGTGASQPARTVIGSQPARTDAVEPASRREREPDRAGQPERERAGQPARGGPPNPASLRRTRV